jgi:prepilin-type N-terminal cleavage/methylation domain-containing protein
MENNMGTPHQKGFSLIELLTAMAIIGILASVVVTGVSGARQRARETGAIAEIQSIALQAEVYYRTNNRSYTGLCANAAITELRDKARGLISTCAGTCFRCNVNAGGSAYAVDLRLSTGPNLYYCVDSVRASKQSATGANGTTACN